MSSQTTISKLSKEIKEVKREIGILRSFAMGTMGKDPEGEYRPEFVRHILRALNEKPTFAFRGKSSFLAELRSRKSR